MNKRIPVDPAGGRCYEDSTKPCKSSRKRGAMLSNMSLICPYVWDTLGKLRLISDRKDALE